jgi:plasmid maintenance system antidote protein VapI
MSIPAKGLSEMRRAPTHPGAIFKDIREQRAVVLDAAARRLRWPRGRLEAFERSRYRLTAGDAVALSVLIGMSAEFWWKLQADRLLWQAMQRAKKRRPIAGRPFPRAKIDYSDIPELTEEDFARAIFHKGPPTKASIKRLERERGEREAQKSKKAKTRGTR